jgi:hypothetical protein
VQQLGSIYERLLEHEIVHEDGEVRIRPNIFARKASGSYYTPDDLVGLILDETLEPLVDRHLEAFTVKVAELDAQVTRYGSPLVLHGPIRSAVQSAAQMQLVEGLTDAEIAEAERSAQIFDQITDMTGPLSALLSFIHALDWLNLRGRRSAGVIHAFFDGQFGDPVQIAMGEVEPRGTRDLPEFLEILNAVRELIREERFLHWQVAFPGRRSR